MYEKNPYKQRDFKTSEFVKLIRVTQSHYDFVNKYHSRKSSAGFLKTIIEEYQRNHPELKTDK